MIAGRYRLEGIAGADGVWRATDLELRRVVAVKRARSGEQTRREARTGSGLRHEGVIAVLDVVRERRERWLVLEYLPSRSLAEILRTGDLLPAGKAASIGAQVAAVLAAMHDKGLVHHDVTPENVLVAEDGTAKLRDFGIAIRPTGFLDPDVDAGPPSDVDALGRVLGEVTSAAIPELSSLTDPDPGERPTAGEVRALLLEIAARPAEAVSPVPRQLPPAPAPFVGRERELRSLEGVRTIGGPGGVGKTWLALRWAHDNLRRFPDGQLFADMGSSDPDAVVHGFLRALGVPSEEIPGERHSRAELFQSLVEGKRMLIVLDNAHGTDPLPDTPTCTVLITSRDFVTLEPLSRDEARELLVLRIGEERAAREPEGVEEILTHCAGFPLELTLAAARLTADPKSSVATTAALLRGYGSGLEMAYHALVERHREIFALVGLAPGPDLTVPAVASLIDGPVTEAAAALRALQRQSLVDEHLPGRWRMHDVVREYAAQPTLSPQERRKALRRLADFYLRSATSGSLEWFDTEHRNLPAVQRLAAAERLGDPAARAWSHRRLGDAFSRAGDLVEARRQWLAAVDLYRAQGLAEEAAQVEERLDGA